MSEPTVASPATDPEERTIPVLPAQPRPEDATPVYVIGDVFYARTSDGLLQVQMRFKTSLFKKVLRSEGDNVEAFLTLIDGIGDEETVAQLDELDIFETARIAADYFTAWREKQQVSMGEAPRSSS